MNDLFKNYPSVMNDFDRIIVSEEEIAEIITIIAERLNNDYKDKTLLLVGLLKGVFMFIADLSRKLRVETEIAFVKASSYGSGSISTGNVEVKFADGEFNCEGYDILIVDDILDSGNTLNKVSGYFKDKGAKSVEMCVLLDKPSRRTTEVDVKYTGKTIEDEFVVGYGLDYSEKYRYLPFIASLKENVYKQNYITGV